MALRRVRENGLSLLALIDDILDLSRIEAGHLKIEKLAFSPEKLVREVIEGLRPIASSRSVFLEVSSAPEVPREFVSDPVRIRQILVNLVGNALKFTSNGTVTVELKQWSPEERTS